MLKIQVTISTIFYKLYLERLLFDYWRFTY